MEGPEAGERGADGREERGRGQTQAKPESSSELQAAAVL